MKRWSIQADNKQLELFFNTKEEAEKAFPNCLIGESLNYEYLEYINKIKDYTIEKELDYRGREILIIKVPNGIAKVRLMFEDIYLDGLVYQIWNYDRFHNPITWIVSNPKDFYNTYLLNDKELEYHIYSFRKYGQPKLTRPKELKGIKQCFSVPYIRNKSKCQCFIKENDLWIKHADYFSESLEEPPELFGTPLEYRCKVLGIKDKKNKFIYPDCWGDIVLRNEAWIILKNIIPQIKIKHEQEMIREVIKKFADCRYHKMRWTDIGSNWNLFWEHIIHELYKIDIDK